MFDLVFGAISVALGATLVVLSSRLAADAARRRPGRGWGEHRGFWIVIGGLVALAGVFQIVGF